MRNCGVKRYYGGVLKYVEALDAQIFCMPILVQFNLELTPVYHGSNF